MKKMIRFLRFLLGSFACSFLLISVNGCEGWWFEKAAYGGIVEGQTLRLLVVSRPATYERLHQLESGFEFELLQQFALDTGYKLQVKALKNEREVQRQLALGKGDLGAARFSNFSGTRPDFLQSPVYDEDKTSLICRDGTDVRFSDDGRLDPSNRWRLIVNSQSAESRFVPYFKQAAPQLKVRTLAQSPSKSQLRALQLNKADCTLMDRHEAHYYLRVFQSLEIVKDISPAHSYFFLISKSRPELAQQMRKWMVRAAHYKMISQTKSHSKGRTEILNYFDVRSFLQAQQNILPQYFEIFKKHCQQFGIPWQLAAAVAYQESKWDPEAVSFTGVRGFMQLTQETAEFLGVADRLDPDQSIWGGVKYLKVLLDRQPKGLPFREKLALALATYNVGPAHMLDAQMLAKKLKKNPYLWKDMRQVLPLLADEKYVAELKYGPARGQEPVDYVHRVFAYLDLIAI